MMRVLVTGSRDWSEDQVIEEALENVRGGEVTLVHGGARGADQIAGAIARRLGFTVEEHHARWDLHGRAAGPRRNQDMVALGADLCLAFIRNSSRGATHCAGLAETMGIPVRYYRA